MEKINYNDRCYLMAVEMAQQIDIEHYDETDIINTLIPSARIAVAKMAEAFKQSYYIWVRTEENIEEYDDDMINYALIEYGLIASTQPDTPTENNNWKL